MPPSDTDLPTISDNSRAPAAPERSAEESAQALSHFAGQLLRDSGRFIANDVSPDHNLDPDVRRMLRDFGLTALETGNKLDPNGNLLSPGYEGEHYNPMRAQRERLQAGGVDTSKPSSVTIGVLDHFDGEASHGQRVSDIIVDPEYGVNPGAKLEKIDRSSDGNSNKFNDLDPTQTSLESAISNTSTSLVSGMTDALRRHGIDERDPDMRVLNVSLGANHVTTAQSIHANFLKEPEKYREWLNKLVGEETASKFIESAKQTTETPDTMALDKVVMEALINKVRDQLSGDEKFQSAMENYRDVTRQIADSGLTIVFAASNQGNPSPNLNLEIKPDDGYNYFAQSDHVISAGAATMNQTPNDNSDDSVAGFSSTGNARFHPTVCAPGSAVGAGDAGTSFSAPAVAATIGLMLDQNPKLSFDQIKKLLTDNASRLSGFGPEAQGAGELNIAEAVLDTRARNARQLRQKKEE